MPRDLLGYCRTCGAGPGSLCRCDSMAEQETVVCGEWHGDGFCNGCAGDGHVLVRWLGASATCEACASSGDCAECNGTVRVLME